MMITFQVESWSTYSSDPALAGLWLEHYNELEPAHEGSMEMGPDSELYSALDSAGKLVILVARSAGRMVGYCLVLVKRHPHYRAVCGFEDSYYLTPSARKGMAGVRLIAEMRKLLRQRGIVRCYWMTKKFASIEKIFLRLGMTEMDKVFVDSLGAW